MDQDNLTYLREKADPIYHDRMHLVLDFSQNHVGADVPDPYYGGAKGFEKVLDLIENAAEGLLTELERVSDGNA